MEQKIIFTLSVFLLSGLLISGCEIFQHYSFCSDYDAEELRLNETVDLKYSELYCNSKYELRLSFDSILDSRCPIGATCIWEGNARVKLHVLQSGKSTSTFWLNTHISSLTDTLVNGIHYELIDLLPYPEAGKYYSLDDYTLQLLISD
jgi:hypothetical protein